MQGLKRELVTQADMYRDEISIYVKQTALAELQLEELGHDLVRVPELEHEISFLSQLSDELREQLQHLLQQKQEARAEQAAAAVHLDVDSLDEAMERLQATHQQKRDVEQRFHAHMERSQQVRASLETQNKELQEQVDSLQATIEKLKEGTTQLFQEQQHGFDEQLEAMQTKLAEAQEAQQKWEEYQQKGSLKARVADARMRLKSTDELAEQLRDKQAEVDALQAKLQQAQDESAALRQQLSSTLHFSEQARNEEAAAAEAELAELRQQLAAAQQRILEEHSPASSQAAGRLLRPRWGGGRHRHALWAHSVGRPPARPDEY